jgi:uncharacterized repeat protein (TIGR03803 family)
LIKIGDAFYGTTAIGGTNDNGTVFVISKAGTERVLYSFKGGSADGTIFALNTSGNAMVLHRFTGGGGGGNPAAGLLNVNGTFYGTASQAELAGPSGDGTIFKISP